MSKGKNLLILSGVVVLMTGIYVMLKMNAAQNTDSPKETAAAKTTVISKLAGDKIVALHVKSTKETLDFQKKSGGWHCPSLPYTIDQDRINLMADSFAQLEAVDVIDPHPTDLSQYGLAQPAITAEAVLNNQTTATLYLGEATVSGNNFYAMLKGDPKVYAIGGPDGSRFIISSNELRGKSLGVINIQECTYFKLNRAGGKTIEITVNPNHAPAKEDYGMSYWQISQPYAETLSINLDRFSKELLPALQNLELNEYIEDQPSDLGKYGLDQPRYELVVKDREQHTLHLLFGKGQSEDSIYCKQADTPAVFTMGKGILSVLETTPFQLVNKIAYLVNINHVDQIVVEAAGKKHKLTLSRTRPKNPKDDPITIYRLDGKTVAEPVFKTFYRSLIGLSFESETPAGIAATNPEVKTTFYMNRGKIRHYQINYVAFNPDFYAIFRNGRSEFALSKNQVNLMLSDLEAMARGKLKARDL